LSTTGFVILDEPTTRLDEKRREDLVAVLSALQNVPQLIIVDYNPELKEVADRFCVSLDAEGNSIVEPEIMITQTMSALPIKADRYHRKQHLKGGRSPINSGRKLVSC